jgi:hypothetical protein
VTGSINQHGTEQVIGAAYVVLTSGFHILRIAGAHKGRSLHSRVDN